MRDDLYEQCSDHITAYMASSRWLGGRPSRSLDGGGLVVGEAEGPVDRRPSGSAGELDGHLGSP